MPRSTGQERKLLALREYFHQYTDENHTKSIKEIIDYLESKDIFACEKTIYKEISILCDILHELVEYNPHKHGYALMKPTFEPYELRLMIDSIQSNFIRHYPAYRSGQLNVSELARLCRVSRTTAYRYLGLLEE